MKNAHLRQPRLPRHKPPLGGGWQSQADKAKSLSKQGFRSPPAKKAAKEFRSWAARTLFTLEALMAHAPDGRYIWMRNKTEELHTVPKAGAHYWEYVSVRYHIVKMGKDLFWLDHPERGFMEKIDLEFFDAVYRAPYTSHDALEYTREMWFKKAH